MADISIKYYKKLWVWIEANTSGIPFLLWGIAGAASAVFIILERKELLVDTSKLYPVLALAAIWFIASDIIKKKTGAVGGIHFLFDSIFYTLFFSFLVFQIRGYSNGLFFIGTAPIISAPLFSSLPSGIAFSLLYSIIFFMAGHLTTGLANLRPYDFGFLALQTTFVITVFSIIKFFLMNLEKSDEGRVDFARGEVDKRTQELKKTLYDLETRDKQLAEKLSELEKFQDLTVGREVKMIELKKQIKELENKLAKTKLNE